MLLCGQKCARVYGCSFSVEYELDLLKLFQQREMGWDGRGCD